MYLSPDKRWPDDIASVCASFKIGIMRSYRLVGWLCLTSHRQRVHLKLAPPFTVPCEGREAWFLHSPHRESNPQVVAWQSILHNRCATPAPQTDIYRHMHLAELDFFSVLNILSLMTLLLMKDLK